MPMSNAKLLLHSVVRRCWWSVQSFGELTHFFLDREHFLGSYQLGPRSTKLAKNCQIFSVFL